jgi:hypothetical protein
MLIKSSATKSVFLLAVIGWMLVEPRVGMACSRPPDMNSDRAPVTYKYEYIAVVTGAREMSMQVPGRPAEQVQALVVKVAKILKNAAPEIKIGDERAIYDTVVHGDCSVGPQSYYLEEYPVGIRVYVRTESGDGGGVGNVFDIRRDPRLEQYSPP